MLKVENHSPPYPFQLIVILRSAPVSRCPHFYFVLCPLELRSWTGREGHGTARHCTSGTGRPCKKVFCEFALWRAGALNVCGQWVGRNGVICPLGPNLDCQYLGCNIPNPTSCLRQGFRRGKRSEERGVPAQAHSSWEPASSDAGGGWQVHPRSHGVTAHHPLPLAPGSFWFANLPNLTSCKAPASHTRLRFQP